MSSVNLISPTMFRAFSKPLGKSHLHLLHSHSGASWPPSQPPPRSDCKLSRLYLLPTESVYRISSRYCSIPQTSFSFYPVKDVSFHIHQNQLTKGEASSPTADCPRGNVPSPNALWRWWGHQADMDRYRQDSWSYQNTNLWKIFWKDVVTSIL